MVICGWARNRGCTVSMASYPCCGSRHTMSSSQTILFTIFWLRGTALCGSAHRRGLPVGRTASLHNIQRLPVSDVDELLQDAEGTLWFGVKDPGRLCTVRAAKTHCYGAGSFGESISALYEDHKGNLWAAAQTGLWRWAPGTPEHYPFPGGAQPNALLEDGNGTLLMATRESSSFGNAVNAGLEGLKQLVDGKIRSYPLPVIAGQFRPTHMCKEQGWQFVDWHCTRFVAPASGQDR